MGLIKWWRRRKRVRTVLREKEIRDWHKRNAQYARQMEALEEKWRAAKEELEAFSYTNKEVVIRYLALDEKVKEVEEAIKEHGRHGPKVSELIYD